MTRLPALGPRGEGWVVIQFILLGLLVVAGFPGGAWAGDVRHATTIMAVALGAGGALLAGAGLAALRESLTALPHPKDGARLIDDGPYALVRHPIYGGLILLAVAWGLFAASPAALAVAAVLLLFFSLKSRREEAWLVTRYPGYEAYRARTRRIIPWLY